jgi:hypothetical protein
VQACSRLADAETRLRPQDQLLDAIIGLETILLFQIDSELSFRFSLNYSTLFADKEERLQKFRIAKDLYRLRSNIVQGNPKSKKNLHRIGDKNIGIFDAAMVAVNALRHVVYHFLSQKDQALFKQKSYWEKRYFCLN